jgi:hypothetical protein
MFRDMKSGLHAASGRWLRTVLCGADELDGEESNAENRNEHLHVLHQFSLNKPALQ